MIIAFFSNYLNHHQVPFSEEVYQMPGVKYYFVETVPMPIIRAQLGYPDFSYKPYLIQAWKSPEQFKQAIKLGNSADVAIFDIDGLMKYGKNRIKNNRLSFLYSERWLKRGLVNILSLNLLKFLWFYHTKCHNKNIYLLCAGAYVSKDYNFLGMFKKKCFKWGYFIDIPLINHKLHNSTNKVRIMWCARYLKWKHPELPIKLAVMLKGKGYDFSVDMYGGGRLFNSMVNLAKRLNVDDCICFMGNTPNSEVLKAMEQHDIFLFTSDKNEGWGVVANEAMSRGAVLVCSNSIGSTPYLIKEGFNGLTFCSGNINSLYEKVDYLIANPQQRCAMSLNGINTMRDVWSSHNAASCFKSIISDIDKAINGLILDGPGSRA